jgi:hypothetical protein
MIRNLLALGTLLVAAACGGSSGTPSSPSSPTTPISNTFAGTYALTIQAPSRCLSAIGSEASKRVYTAAVTQTSGNVSVTLSAGTGGTTQEYSTGSFAGQIVSGQTSGDTLTLNIYIAEMIKGSQFKIEEINGTAFNLKFSNSTTFGGLMNGVISGTTLSGVCGGSDIGVEFRRK